MAKASTRKKAGTKAAGKDAGTAGATGAGGKGAPVAGKAGTAAPAPAEASAPVLKRKELIARAAAASGLKPGEIRRALDGILGELGKALGAGETVNLPPLGKITVKRREQNESRQLVICRLRRRIGEKTGQPALEPLAE